MKRYKHWYRNSLTVTLVLTLLFSILVAQTAAAKIIQVPDTRPIADKAPEPTPEPPIMVFIDGQQIVFDEQPFLDQGTTLVQFRPIFEKLGLKIEWDDKTRTIVGTSEKQRIRLGIDQTDAEVNGTAMDLAVAPHIIKNVTFVPLRFVGEASGKKVLWDGKLRAVYIYDPSTEGKLYFENRQLMYEGQLKDGKMNGKGKLYREDGSLWYDAEFKDNEADGLGTFVQKGYIEGNDVTGYYAVGEISHGIPEGKGRGYDAEGNLIYEGHFHVGKYEGKGRYYYNGILVYEGDFAKNQYHGNGKTFWKGYVEYEGEFKFNNKHGKGKQYRSLDHRLLYDGEYKNDKWDGFGTYYELPGYYYVGEWKGGYEEGKGKSYEGNELVYEGSFHQRIMEGYGKMYYPDKKVYEGMFRSGEPHGQGKLIDENGKIIYEGEYINGKPKK